MAKITFITGASGVGKSTLVAYLKAHLKEQQYHFFHFDDIGIPSSEEMIEQYGSTSKWQESVTHDWIKKIVKASATKPVIFEGQTNLDFIENGFQKLNFTDYSMFKYLPL